MESSWPPEPPWLVTDLQAETDELSAMIPSAVVRNELKKAGRELSDLDRAVLLSRNREAWQIRMQRLASLRDRTEDSTLRSRLTAMTDRARSALREFLENDSGLAAYRSACAWPDGSESTGSLFSNADAAWHELAEDNPQNAQEVRIDKIPLLAAADTVGRVESVVFGKGGSILALRGTEDREWAEYVAEHFAELPHPFRRGDLVRTTDGRIYGVIECGGAYHPDISPETLSVPWRGEAEPFRLAVFNEETGLFGSTADIQPAELEYYEPEEGSCDTMDGLLLQLSEIYKGSGWLTDFSGYTLRYRSQQGYDD